MPLYWFQIEVPLPQQRVMERIRPLVHEEPRFERRFIALWTKRNDTLKPFIGSVDNDSFRMRPNIWYRNSFLPLIRGHVLPAPAGTQIIVTMSMHPAVAVFMAIWLGMAGLAAIFIFLKAGATGIRPAVMFLFGAALMCGGFFPEAFKAKRILSDAISGPGSTTQA